MSDNSNQENATAENDDFPSDYTEYYYWCRISNIESGAEDFYYVINVILYNWKEIIEVADDTQNDCSKNSFIKQLIRYNNDFHSISEKLIRKSGINSIEDYRNNFNLLIRIVNETMMFLSEYYVYDDKKIGNKKLINIINDKSRIYIDYNISEMPVYEFTGAEKKIKFKKLVVKISGVSDIINLNDMEIIIDKFKFLPTVLFMLIAFIALSYIIVIIIQDIIICICEKNILKLLEWLACIAITILIFKIFIPISDHTERRKKSYNQSKNYVINLKDKKKIKWSAVWSLAREIILSRFGSND